MDVIKENIEMILFVCICAIVVLLMALIALLRKNQDEDAVLTAKINLNQEINARIKGISRRLFHRHQHKYHELQVFLSQIGANYMLGRVIDPAEYVFASIGIGLMAAIVLSVLLSSPIGILGLIPGCYILKFILIGSNETDNEAILEDIISIYNTLKIKTEGGMFLTAALQECYRVAENRRLKSALLELTGEIATKNNVDNAVKKFQLKFKNRFLNSFALIVAQSYASGQMLNFLSDITAYLMEVQRIKNIKESQKLEMDIMKVEMLLLALMTIVCLYTVFVSYGNLLSGTQIF